MEDRLDLLLADVRPSEPEDDGFSDRVMLAVRSDLDGRRSWGRKRRFFTRPAVLASAAVLIAGGALAAVSTTTAPEKDAASREPSATASIIVGTAAPSVTAGAPAADGTVHTDTVEAPGEPARTVYKSGSYEWGYTSPHTAYVLDHATGLRLQTETYGNEFSVGKAQRVTLTLTNTSSRPLGIYAPNGCALSASAFGDDGRSADPSKVPTSPTDARTECSDKSSTGTAERFVLGAGGSRTADAEITLPSGGNWGVIGACECNLVNPDDDGEDPVNDLTKLVIGATVGDVGTETTSSDYRLFTPAIRIEGR
jgi:hypothetical protein